MQLINLYVNLVMAARAYSKILGRYSYVGSPEMIFLASNWGLRNKFSLKLASQELKLLPKLNLKMQNLPPPPPR